MVDGTPGPREAVLSLRPSSDSRPRAWRVSARETDVESESDVDLCSLPGLKLHLMNLRSDYDSDDEDAFSERALAAAPREPFLPPPSVLDGAHSRDGLLPASASLLFQNRQQALRGYERAAELFAEQHMSFQQQLSEKDSIRRKQMAETIQRLQNELLQEASEGNRQLTSVRKTIQEQQEQARREDEERARQEALRKAAEEAETQRKAQEDAAKQLAEQKLREEQEQARAQAAAAAAAQAAQATQSASQSATEPANPAPAAGQPAPARSGRSRAIQEAEARATELLALKQRADACSDRSLRLDTKKRMNTYVQQISGTRQQVEIKSREIVQLLAERTRISETAYAFAVIELAERFVAQGEAQVEANQSSAFAIAAVLGQVSQAHPIVLETFLAHLNKVCPVSIPRYVPKREGQTNEAYLEECGYARSGQGFEDDESYARRMCGYISLLGALLQTQCQGAEPFIGRAWAWLAAICNRKPKRITSDVIAAFLKAAGFSLSNTYRSQFRKLMVVIQESLLPLMAQQGENRGGETRLRMLVQDYMRTGRFEEPEGRRMPAVNVIVD